MGLHGRIATFTINGLFGHDPSVEFTRDSAVTILTGPNGSGKTHTLKLLRCLLSMDFAELFVHPYDEIRLTFENESYVQVTREHGDENPRQLSWIYKEFRKPPVDFVMDSEGFDIANDGDTSNRSWRAERTRFSPDGSLVYIETGERDKVRETSERKRKQILGLYPGLRRIADAYPSTFIDTKRLDTYVDSSGSREDVYRWDSRSELGASGRMREYVSEIRSQITEARRESLKRSQEADESFAANLLNRSKQTVDYGGLVRKYERLSQLSDELSNNGLAGKVSIVKIPARATPTEKRILDLFMHDWERKLEPLLPIHTKLEALTRIVNNKFTAKTLQFDQRGYARFWAKNGTEIRVDQLSSGEQHLLALFTRLLFSAEIGSTVLIDEPEISLHAAWKHAFIEDIEEVAEIADLTVVMATHSTAIVNGRWELVQELGDVDES